MAGRDATLEAFKARIPLAELIGRYVKLTRRGREHVGLCPFHKEKSPSFNVVEEKGFYHCFGCGAHGTAIDFVMAIEGLGFPEALERVADLVGIPAPRRAAQAGPDPSGRLLAANEAAAAWFRAALAGPAGAEARAYLERRGVLRETTARFGLGYAPEGRQALRAALRAEGFGEAELQAAGLLARPETGEPYDRFRHRLMFPIADERGRVVGFGGRALGEARAKYLNTADTDLFHKGELLYNLHRAAKPARERREIVLAEGYMDVIALAQAGFEHAVAPLGTAVTERQLEGLWRLAPVPVLCLDGDRAGLAAAMRAAERALPLMRGERGLRFAILPDGEDPDSYLRRHGAAAMGGLLSRAHSLSQMVWRLETGGRTLATPEARAALAGRLRTVSRLAADPDLRHGLWDQFRALLDELAPRRPPPRGRKAAKPRATAWEGVGALQLAAGVPDAVALRELRLIAPIIEDPSLLADVEEDLLQLSFASNIASEMLRELTDWYIEGRPLDGDLLRQRIVGVFGRETFASLEKLFSPKKTGRDKDEVRRSLLAFRRRASLQEERLAIQGRLDRAQDGEKLASLASLDALMHSRDEEGAADRAGEWDSHLEELRRVGDDVLSGVRSRTGKTSTGPEGTDQVEP